MIINFANLGGGGGGTTNYNSLQNKPQINSITLSGNTSLSTLGVEKKSISLTQAQYDALATKEADVDYIITDATAIDMNDYASQTDLTTLSASTTTALAGKAAKQAVDAVNKYAYYYTNYMPTWNTEGVITGKGMGYTGTFSYVNGSSRTIAMVSEGNTSSINIYAPTAVGSNGQILKSTGSGAPSWVDPASVIGGVTFWVGTQEEYDELGTYSNSVVYLIKEDE